MSDQPAVINRIATVVTPREPCLAWARRLDDDDGPSIDELPSKELTSVYLIEEAEEAEHSLRRHWEWIFDEITECEKVRGRPVRKPARPSRTYMA